MNALKLFSVAALACASMPAAAAVDLTGATVIARLLYPDTSTTLIGPETRTVGPGVEYSSGTFLPSLDSIDISADQVIFSSNQVIQYADGDFNGYRLDFSGFTGTLDGLTIDPSSTFVPRAVYLQGNSLFINVANQLATGTTVINLGDGAAAVPEPATWAMLIGGFGLTGGALRRRVAKVAYAAA